MNKRIVPVVLSLFFISLSFGQDMEKYNKLVDEASNLYEAEDYKKSAEKYKEAFELLDGKIIPSDRYDAACSYALSEDVESAFYYLLDLAEGPAKFRDYDHITTDSDLNILHADSRWADLISKVKANKEEFEKDYDESLIAILDTIFQEDQKYRREMMEVAEEYGWDSEEIDVIEQMMKGIDSINLIKVKKIIDEYGWLGPRIIGDRGNQTLFLVIQHSDPKTREKYLPIMREAVKEGNAYKSDLALLEDRTALEQGGLQMYGTQIGRYEQTGEFFVRPLFDPDNVNKRRFETELESIENYVSYWGLLWNAEDYKKRLSEYEIMEKSIR